MIYANRYVFLWHFIMCFCGIMLRVFVVTNWMRFENMESKMVYTIRGKCSVYYVSRVSVFF